ncbi:IclR family transcriptional regulator [Sulfitobacter sp.]|uniref:IclR family transcriptional regulator n=1 Tax=Sulfitobacter sp. TaxID=1903071 RepID=UPI003296965E
MQSQSSLFVKSLGKAFQVLDAFKLSGGTGRLSHADLVRLSGMDSSTVQRMTHTLVEIGLLERGPNKTYLLGRQFLTYSFEFLRSSPVVQLATPILLDLRRETGERVDLSLFNDVSIIYAVRRQSKRQTFHATLIGRQVPTFASSGGRAMMAHLDRDARLDILERSELRAFTPRTETDPDAILAAVEQAAEAGYALCMEQIMLGEIVLACPILSPQGAPLGAIHVSGSLSEWNPDEFCTRHAPLAFSAAESVSGGL